MSTWHNLGSPGKRVSMRDPLDQINLWESLFMVSWLYKLKWEDLSTVGGTIPQKGILICTRVQKSTWILISCYLFLIMDVQWLRTLKVPTILTLLLWCNAAWNSEIKKLLSPYISTGNLVIVTRKETWKA